MYLEKIDEERYRTKINTKIGEKYVIIHKSQLNWLTEKEIEDLCNKQLTINFI